MKELRELFKYQAWATLQLVDHAATLPEHKLREKVPGSLGSITETFLHMIDQERWGLHVLQSGVGPFSDPSLPGIRAAFVEHANRWATVFDRWDELNSMELPQPKDWDRSIPEFPLMYALQTAHHLELHRTHLRMSFRMLGHPLEEEDSTDVWAYWDTRGESSG